jgi:hypothetical protein
MTTQDTYVHDAIEVKKTGRTASKPAPGAGNRKIELVEITPADEYDGTWKKWVNPAALFVINKDTQ